MVAAQHAHAAAQSLLTSVAEGPEVEQLVNSASADWQDGLALVAEPVPEPAVEAAAERASHQAWRPATVAHPEPLPERVIGTEQCSTNSTRSREPHFPELRSDPREEATVSPAQAVPSKLIEFPRELVAPMKSRPRLAEGPLTEPAPQLRIFEVEGTAGETETLGGEGVSDQEGLRSAAAMAGADRSGLDKAGMREVRETPTEAPEWHSIRLGALPEPIERQAAVQAETLPAAPHQAPLHTASLEDRLMAAMVDLGLMGMGFLCFVLAFAAATPHLAPVPVLWAMAAISLVALCALYQWLFMSYGSGTPGMRYARIALCSFADDNPTRRAMRSRVGATLLAVLPLGLGLLWVLFDEDRLCWQDRMTRTYQRSYR